MANEAETNAPGPLRQRVSSTKATNLLLLGASAVGKSCIFSRAVEPGWEFKEEMGSTVAARRPVEKVFKIDQETYTLRVWDIGGPERFEHISKGLLKEAQGVVVVFSVDDAHSFETATTWLESISELRNPKHGGSRPDLQVVLACNKIDLEGDSVRFKDWEAKGKKLSSAHDVPFFGTSAKTNKGIDEMFEVAARGMKKAAATKKLADERGQNDTRGKKGKTKTGKSTGCVVS